MKPERPRLTGNRAALMIGSMSLYTVVLFTTGSGARWFMLAVTAIVALVIAYRMSD